MRFSRTPALLLALSVMLSLHVTVASAAQATAELRAIACCDMGCEHAPGTAPARCCGVERESQSLKAPAPTAFPPVVWVAELFATPPLARSTQFVHAGDAGSPPGRAAPLFLRTRSLRI